MELLETIFDAVLVFKPKERADSRGTMHVFYSTEGLHRYVAEFSPAEQRVYTMPGKGTFFGIHYQASQAKLVSVIQGCGMDYVIDLRKDSPTFCRWKAMELSGKEPKLVYLPAGFGHAFLSLEDNTIQLFAVDLPFESGIGGVIHYKDPSIRLHLPQGPKYLSDYDRNAPFIGEGLCFIWKQTV